MINRKSNDIKLFVAKVLRKLKLKKLSRIYNLKRRHKPIMKYLDSYFKQSQSTAVDNAPMPIECKVRKTIWVFWWQGEEKMPSLVKKCFNSLKKCADGIEVILITEQNIREYARFPEYIYSKVAENFISLTHLSDILRFNLLLNYGGLYVDATVFWTKAISDEHFSEFFTCGKYNDEYFFNVADGRWTGFLIGGCSGNPFFHFMNNFFLQYWKEKDVLIDYFMIDYGINHAYNYNIGNIRPYIDNIKQIHPHLFTLNALMNKPYDDKSWELIRISTSAFKLSYKTKYKENGETYYSVIMK